MSFKEISIRSEDTQQWTHCDGWNCRLVLQCSKCTRVYRKILKWKLMRKIHRIMRIKVSLRFLNCTQFIRRFLLGKYTLYSLYAYENERFVSFIKVNTHFTLKVYSICLIWVYMSLFVWSTYMYLFSIAFVLEVNILEYIKFDEIYLMFLAKLILWYRCFAMMLFKSTKHFQVSKKLKTNAKKTNKLSFLIDRLNKWK